MRGFRTANDNDDVDMLPGQTTPTEPVVNPPLGEGEKPRRKPPRRKPKSKLAESFPPYLQEAFFGKDLMDTTKEMESTSGSDEESSKIHGDKTIQLSQVSASALLSPYYQKVQQMSIFVVFVGRIAGRRRSESEAREANEGSA